MEDGDATQPGHTEAAPGSRTSFYTARDTRTNTQGRSRSPAWGCRELARVLTEAPRAGAAPTWSRREQALPGLGSGLMTVPPSTSCQEASAPAEGPDGSPGEAEPDRRFRGMEAPADRICVERTARGAGGGAATPHSPPVPRKVEHSDHGPWQFPSRAETTGTSNARPHERSRTNDSSCAARGGHGERTAERRRRRAATTRRSSFRHETNRRSAQATSATPRVRPGHTGHHRGWALPASFKRRPCRGRLLPRAPAAEAGQSGGEERTEPGDLRSPWDTIGDPGYSTKAWTGMTYFRI
ncbi:uncharacterized protein LOC144334886 [Macaca mulatta]